MSKADTKAELQEALVKQVLKLPDELLEAVVQTSRERLIEEMVMAVGDATRFASNPNVAHRVQQHLFHTFLDTGPSRPSDA